MLGGAPKGEESAGMRLRPVGVVRGRIEEPSLVARFGDLEWQATMEKAKEERSAISDPKTAIILPSQLQIGTQTY